MSRFQGAAALSVKIRFFVPYAGIRYEETRDLLEGLGKAQLPKSSFLLRNRHRFGGSAGFGIFPGDFFAISVEGRFYDEAALSLFIDLKF